MHHVGRLSETAPDEGVYRGHAAGLTRLPIVGPETGSVHQTMTVVELAPGGRVDRHLHAFEEGLYVLEGAVRLHVAGADEELGADGYAFVDAGVAHAVVNEGPVTARWLEVAAPQPVDPAADTVFSESLPGASPEPAYRIARFDLDRLPAPSSSIGLAGFGEANVGGASLEVLVQPAFGASQFTLMFLQYVEGGLIREHDHPFEEGFLFLSGEIEAVLDGRTYVLRAGDYCWSGVGGLHAMTNRSPEPVRWLETQAPQPPGRHQARFRADWERLAGA